MWEVILFSSKRDEYSRIPGSLTFVDVPGLLGRFRVKIFVLGEDMGSWRQIFLLDSEWCESWDYRRIACSSWTS